MPKQSASTNVTAAIESPSINEVADTPVNMEPVAETVSETVAETVSEAVNETASAGAKRKRAANPFMLYSKENRQSVRDQYPDMKMTDISKKLGESWRALSDEDKNMYRAKSIANEA